MLKITNTTPSFPDELKKQINEAGMEFICKDKKKPSKKKPKADKK